MIRKESEFIDYKFKRKNESWLFITVMGIMMAILIITLVKWTLEEVI